MDIIFFQWFGNFVTMKWWTDLWLNEGFASYTGAVGVAYIHPEWNMVIYVSLKQL